MYHELFDEAVERYNAKQTRSDRRIDDYYEKIRTGRQEKLFHELILQIGNKDDCGAETEDGRLAAEILDEYMRQFQARNPTLKVFSAHLHMDEATPHLHIDFIPYITGSKRGVDTRVSLKQALAALGFHGGTRRETEWTQWVNSEKEQLAAVMERHGIEWEHMDTHEEHLSVLDYKKQERAKEVAELETEQSALVQTNASLNEANTALSAENSLLAESNQSLRVENETLHDQLSSMDDDILNAQDRRETAEQDAEYAKKKAEKAERDLSTLTANMQKVEKFAVQYVRDPVEWLPDPLTLEPAKSYRNRILPLLRKVMGILQPLYSKYMDIKAKYNRLSEREADLNTQIQNLHDTVAEYKEENRRLQSHIKDLDRVKAIMGSDVIDEVIQKAKSEEQVQEKQKRLRRNRSRDAL